MMNHTPIKNYYRKEKYHIIVKTVTATNTTELRKLKINKFYMILKFMKIQFLETQLIYLPIAIMMMMSRNLTGNKCR